MNQDLQHVRKRIDEVDQRFLEVLAQRQQIIDEVASLKTDRERPIRDKQREKELLAELRHRAREVGVSPQLVTDLFERILSHSVRRQVDHMVEDRNMDRTSGHVQVAYQGATGAYSHLAAQRHFEAWASELTCRGCDTIQEVAEAVENGAADYAVLPLENAAVGSVHETYNLLARRDLHIVGEETVDVEHCLLAVEPVSVRSLKRIYSHPQVLAECSDFLAALGSCVAETHLDTALAARKIQDEGDPAQAAIASEEAATRYGLHVIKRGIANQDDNHTRFVVVAREPVKCQGQVPCRTSLIFTLPDKSEGLTHALSVFAAHDVTLTKMETRPQKQGPCRFYVDVEGGIGQQRIKEALDELRAKADRLIVLGSYPTEPTGEQRPDPEASTNGKASHRKASVRQKAPEKPDVMIKSDRPYQLAARAHRPEGTRIQVGEVTIGGDTPVLIAGPCSVESREQTMACAEAVAGAGGHILRGGCFKPRTSPYSFQGLGYEGLDLLEEAGRTHDLPIITEVLHPSDVHAVARQADILQIGARNMQNFALLKTVGQADRPVMLKRGMMASIDEWLAAAEYILAHGNEQVFLCERGIRTFETATRNTLDISAVPVIRERTHLPIIVDPAHACGTRRWIQPLVEAAVAAGAHGVMVEVHPNPEEALSDGPQSLPFDDFAELAASFRAVS